MDRARLQIAADMLAGPAAEPPLVVDLDGTLLRGDSLVESLFAVARADPLALLKLPVWLAQGRARLKQRLAERAIVDVHTLPFDRALLDHLRPALRRWSALHQGATRFGS